MDTIEAKIRALLNGEIDENEDKEFLHVDYSLQQQNYELTARGIDPKVSDEFRPKINLNLTYVVTAVIINNQNEVLMMQEAKSSCAGSWYLPAARVEPLERLEDAVKRGVFRETGLEFTPTTILKVESSHGNWYRFVYAGNVTGGQLKTVAKADQESLQACYVADISKLPLRSQDCLKLIELGREYWVNKQMWHAPQLTIHRSVPNLFLRLLVVSRNKQTSRYHAVISDSLVPHLPLCEINPTRSIHSSLKRFMQHIFGSESSLPQHKPFGLLAIEHDCAVLASQYDGLCLTMLVVCKDSSDALSLSERSKTTGFTWIQLGSQLEPALSAKLFSKRQTICHTVL